MTEGRTTGAGPAHGTAETGDPVARLKHLVDRALAPLVPVLAALEGSHWNLPVRPEVVLRAVAFMALLDSAGEPLVLRSGSESMVRWFLGMRSHESAMDPQTLGVGQHRLIGNVLARQFVKDVVAASRTSAGVHAQAFHENAALIEAWTGQIKGGARRVDEAAV